MVINNKLFFKRSFVITLTIIFLSSMVLLSIVPLMRANPLGSLIPPEINPMPNEIELTTHAWVPNGTAICALNYDEGYPQICSDGAGGAIIVWNSLLGDPAYLDIWGQRIDSDGVLQWTVNGRSVAGGLNDQLGPQICTDGNGGAIIVWEDHRNLTNYDIYAQRLNSTGFMQWTGTGVAICTANNNQRYPHLYSDGVGGAFITWSDYRNGTNLGIYAQRVNAAGVAQWTANGVVIGQMSDGFSPQLCSDGIGGVIIAYGSNWNGTSGIYAQQINPAGVIQWPENGVAICTVNYTYGPVQICSDSNNGAIIAYLHYQSELFDNADIYAQRVNSTGGVQWAENGMAICTAENDQREFQLCSDGAGGAIITWEDYRIDFSNGNIYTQRITSIGDVMWIDNGSAVCTASYLQQYPQLCSDGAGGAIITWVDKRSVYNTDIYAQRISATGISQWTANGTAICTASNDQTDCYLISNGIGGAFITWADRRGAVGNIYVQKLESNPPRSFSIYSLNGWVNDQKPTIICNFWVDFCGVNASAVQYAYSTDGSTNPTNWVPVNETYKDAACTSPATDGDAGWLYAKALTVPFNQDSISQNTIRFRATDMVNNTGTQETASVIQIDTAINIPISTTSSPNDWTSTNAFNLTWTNPADLSGIVGVYYELDSAPISNIEGTYVAGTEINALTGITVSGDGAHAIYIWLVDAAGNIDFTKYNNTTLYFDTSINVPIGVTASPISWTSTNAFNITWTNPSELSGIVGVYYKLDSIPVSNMDGTYVVGTGINTLTGITVSGDGAHAIYIWLVDAVGNIDFNTYQTTTLYLNTETTQQPIPFSPFASLCVICVLALAFFRARCRRSQKNEKLMGEIQTL